MFTVLYSPNELVYFLGFFPPGSGSASVLADPVPDPEGISLCGSVRIWIRMRNNALKYCLVSLISVSCVPNFL